MPSKILVGAVFAFGALSNAYAGTSAFDSSFGNNGKVLGTGYGIASQDTGRSVLRQSDGKLILAGTTSTVAGGSDFLVMRLSADGQPDASFGTAGSTAIDFANGNDFGYDAALQADGKIMVVGSCTGAKTILCAARLNTDGSLDPTFAAQGKFSHEFVDGDGTGTLVKVAVQSDGRLVAGGSRDVSTGPSQGIVIRLNSNGAFDPTFASNGVYQSGVAGIAAVQAIALDSQGRIVAGYTGSVNLSALRLTAAGALDLSFNGSGTASFDYGGSDTVYAVAVDASDRVLIGGRSQICGWATKPCASPSTNRFDGTMARFNADGSMDSGFGVNGVTTTDVRDFDYIMEIEVAATGDVYAAGRSHNPVGLESDYLTFVAKFDSAG